MGMYIQIYTLLGYDYYQIIWASAYQNCRNLAVLKLHSLCSKIYKKGGHPCVLQGLNLNKIWAKVYRQMFLFSVLFFPRTEWCETETGMGEKWKERERDNKMDWCNPLYPGTKGSNTSKNMPRHRHNRKKHINSCTHTLLLNVLQS